MKEAANIVNNKKGSITPFFIKMKHCPAATWR
jgi:hypothetical protein